MLTLPMIYLTAERFYRGFLGLSIEDFIVWSAFYLSLTMNVDYIIYTTIAYYLSVNGMDDRGVAASLIIFTVCVWSALLVLIYLYVRHYDEISKFNNQNPIGI